MSHGALLGGARAFADRMTFDTCTVERLGRPVTSPIDGTVTHPQRRTIYSGRCRIQAASAPWAGPATVGQAAVGMGALTLQVPIAGTEAITKDDVVTVTACRHDTALTGKSFSVQGTHYASEKGWRKLPLLEVVG